MKCEEYRHWAEADDEPTPALIDAMARHLEQCAACAARLQADSVELVQALYQRTRQLHSQAVTTNPAPDQPSQTALKQLQKAARAALQRLIDAVTQELTLGLSPTFAALRDPDSPFTPADEAEIARLLSARDYPAALEFLRELEERVQHYSERTLTEVRQHEALCHAGQGDYLHARAYLEAATVPPPLPGLWPDLLVALTQILAGDPVRARALLEAAAGEWRPIVAPVLRAYEETSPA